MLSLSSRSVGRVARPARLVSRNRRARIGASVPQRGFRRGIVRAAAADDDEDGDDDDDAPDHLKCPISQMLLRDPVTTADGQTYERKHITKWLKRHTTSPLTGAELASKQLTPNVLAKKAVEAYREDRDKKPAAAPAAAAAAAAPRASAASDEPPAKKARAAPY